MGAYLFNKKENMNLENKSYDFMSKMYKLGMLGDESREM